VDGQLRRRKTRAAAVLILWMATVVALWGVDAAGRRAVRRSECGDCDFSGKGIALEMADSPAEVIGLLEGAPGGRACDAGGCVRGAVMATTRADDLLVPAYGLLTAALFLLLAANVQGRRAGLLLALLGGSLAVAAALADWYENAKIRALIVLAERPGGDPDAMSEPLGKLQGASAVKWGALALGVLVLAVLWRKRAGWAWPLWVLKALGVGAGLALSGGLAWAWLPGPWRASLADRGLGESGLVTWGAGLLFLFWTAAMIGAIRDAVARQPDLEHRPTVRPMAGAAATPAEGP
jgi:hypothetical protein